jgi:hypothetical protein
MPDSPGHGLREGGPQVFKKGSLKRRLPIVTVAQLSLTDSSGPAGVQSRRLLLKNLNADLKVHIVGAVVSANGNTPVLPASVPAGAATMQLTPKVISGDSVPMYLRPVFQDPTLAQNQNHPLAQDLPFGWEFSTNADDVEIEIIITPALWVNANILGKVLVMVDIEYDGAWWDIKAVEYALAQPQLIGFEPFVVLAATP